MSEIGYSGTEIYSGIISEDYNSKLQFPESIDLYDQMRKGDATVSAVLSAVKLPIINGNYFVTPASEDKRDMEIAEFVEKQFFEVMVWSEFMKGVLLAFDFGFMTFEKVYQKVDNNIFFKRMAQRLPKSIQKWLTTPQYMKNIEHPGIEQNILNDIDPKKNGKNVYIPGSKIFRYTLDQEGENFDGVSLLRPAYKHWYYKEKSYKVQFMASERNGVGLPVARKTLDIDIKAAEETKIVNTLKGLRANEKAYLIEPYGWEFRLETASNQFDFDPQILHHDRQITKSALAQFLELGVNKGALSQSKSDQNLFLKSVMAHVTEILGKINRELVTEIVMMNFDNVTEFPKIEVTDIVQDDLGELSVAAQRMTQVGLITPDDETENLLRKKFKFPARDFEKNPRPKKEGIADDEKKEVKKNEPKKEEKKEIKDEKKKLMLSEFVPSRPLTLAEEKMDIPGIVNFFNAAVIKISKTAEGYSRKLEKQLLSDTKAFLKGGKFPPLPPEITEARRETIKGLQKELMESFDFGKTQATRELGKQERGKTPPESRVMAGTSSKAFAEKQTADMKAEAQLTASTGKSKGLKDSEIMGAVIVGLNSIKTRQNQLFAGLSNTGMLNSGRATTYEKFKKDISRYQYSAVLDDRTSPTCLSLDGRVTEKLTDLPMPPTHANCRSQILAISKEQTEQPSLNPPPKSVVDKISPNPFKTIQPKTPTNIKGTPAKKIIDEK